MKKKRKKCHCQDDIYRIKLVGMRTVTEKDVSVVYKSIVKLLKLSSTLVYVRRALPY